MNKKIIIVSSLLLVGAVFFWIRLLTPEDRWVCVNESWVKHGNPAGLPPSAGCGPEKIERATNDSKVEIKLASTTNPNPKIAGTVPHDVAFTGLYVCLPSSGAGPQTLECALGLRGDDGKYYALDASAVRTMSDIATGSRIEIVGLLTPTEMLSTDHWRKYNIAGIIRLNDFKEIE